MFLQKKGPIVLNYGIKKKLSSFLMWGKIVNISKSRTGLIVGILALLSGSHAMAMKNIQEKMVVLCSKQPDGFVAETKIDGERYLIKRTYWLLHIKTLFTIKISINNEKIPQHVRTKLLDAMKQYKRFVNHEWEGDSVYNTPPSIHYPYDL